LQQPGGRAAPVAAAAAPRGPGPRSRARSRASRPIPVFLIPLDRQFPFEPRQISPLDRGEYSMIFNYAEICWTKAQCPEVPQYSKDALGWSALAANRPP